MNYKKWNGIVVGSILVLMLLFAAFIAIVDPYLHYHKPLSMLEYPLKAERYVNDGLLRHMDYEAVITGTSMSHNFRPSLFQELWGVEAIKTTYSGAWFHELAGNMRRALHHNAGIRYFLCSLDPRNMLASYNGDEYRGYPEYLYDDNPFNDVNYLFNKDVFLDTVAVLNYTKAGNKTPDRDLYARYDVWSSFGREAVMASFTRAEIVDLSTPFTEEEKSIVEQNMLENYVKVAREHPDVEFLFFIPPYSICYWDDLVRTNQLELAIDIRKCGITYLLENTENVHVYAYDDITSITGSLDNYMDAWHYSGEISDFIMRSICEGAGELTADNCDAYFDCIKQIYETYDYSILEE